MPKHKPCLWTSNTKGIEQNSLLHNANLSQSHDNNEKWDCPIPKGLIFKYHSIRNLNIRTWKGNTVHVTVLRHTHSGFWSDGHQGTPTLPLFPITCGLWFSAKASAPDLHQTFEMLMPVLHPLVLRDRNMEFYSRTLASVWSVQIIPWWPVS